MIRMVFMQCLQVLTGILPDSEQTYRAAYEFANQTSQARVSAVKIASKIYEMAVKLNITEADKLGLEIKSEKDSV